LTVNWNPDGLILRCLGAGESNDYAVVVDLDVLAAHSGKFASPERSVEADEQHGDISLAGQAVSVN